MHEIIFFPENLKNSRSGLGLQLIDAKMLSDNRFLNFDILPISYHSKFERRSQNVLTTFAWSMKLISPSNCSATLSSECYLFEDKMFQLKVGTFAQNKCSITVHPLCL